MNNLRKYDVIIILGGGRDNQGNLTQLSIQRLDKGYELYQRGEARKIFALGEYLSTYNPNAIHFKKTGAKLKRTYLVEKRVPPEDIILVEEARDTIGEALASRKRTRELGFKKILLVTSDKHMERALWTFRRTFGKGFTIEGRSVASGDFLNEDEERKYLGAVKDFFRKLPEDIPNPNLETWYEDHKELYNRYEEIRDRYHPPSSPKSQAYMGVRDK
jgi:uncharacterized SAM-binding protein YcdF (DUF218 family)